MQFLAFGQRQDGRSLAVSDCREPQHPVRGIWSVASQSWVTHSCVTWHCPATCPKRTQGFWRLCGLCHGFGQASKMPKRRLRKNSLFRLCGFPAVFAPTAARVVAKPLASRTMHKARRLSVLLEVTEVDRQGAVKFCSTYTAKLGRCFYNRPWLLEMPCKNGRKPKTEVHGRPKPGFGEKLSSRCARWWKLTHPTSQTWRCRNAALRRSFDVGNRKVLEACFFIRCEFYSVASHVSWRWPWSLACLRCLYPWRLFLNALATWASHVNFLSMFFQFVLWNAYCMLRRAFDRLAQEHQKQWIARLEQASSGVIWNRTSYNYWLVVILIFVNRRTIC